MAAGAGPINPQGLLVKLCICTFASVGGTMVVGAQSMNAGGRSGPSVCVCVGGEWGTEKAQWLWVRNPLISANYQDKFECKYMCVKERGREILQPHLVPQPRGPRCPWPPMQWAQPAADCVLAQSTAPPAAAARPAGTGEPGTPRRRRRSGPAAATCRACGHVCVMSHEWHRASSVNRDVSTCASVCVCCKSWIWWHRASSVNMDPRP